MKLFFARFDKLVVQPDLAELVDDDGGPREFRLAQQMTQHGGLAAAEKAGEHRNGDHVRARTMSTYSRVFSSGFPHSCPCQPSTTCGPDVPTLIQEPAAGKTSSVAAVMAAFAGDRPGSCMIAVPGPIVDVSAPSQASGVIASTPHASAAHGRVPEPLRLARKLDQLERLVPGCA